MALKKKRKCKLLNIICPLAGATSSVSVFSLVTLLCGLSLLCYCTSKKEKELVASDVTIVLKDTIKEREKSNETASSKKLTPRSQTTLSQDDDTVTVFLGEETEYSVYVRLPSYEYGPQGSWNEFVMYDKSGKEVFRSFDNAYGIEEYPDHEAYMGLLTMLVPIYYIEERQAKNVLSVNLAYINLAKGPNGYSPTDEVPKDYIGLKRVETQGNLYKIGFIEDLDGALRYTPLYEPYPCSISLDSLKQLYEQKKNEEDRKTLILLESVYRCGLFANDTSLYNEMALFSKESSGGDIVDRKRYYYMYKFLAYHLGYPFLSVKESLSTKD